MALAQRVDPAPNAPRLLAERALDRMREPWLLGIAALTLLALLLRLYGIGHQSFWYDESLTVDETHLRFLRMMSMVRHHEVTPPLYFVSAWTWAKVFGHGEAGLRALSALAGALMVPATAACAATLAGRRAAVIAGALIATSPLLIWYSQEARAYALFTLLATLSWLFFVRVLSAGNKVDVALWAAASALTIATHYFGIFLVGPEIAWLLLRARRRGVVVIGAAVIGGVGLVLAPVATSRRTAGTGWIHGIHLNLRLRQIPEQLASGFSAPQIATLATYALVALSILLLVVGFQIFRRTWRYVAAAWTRAGDEAKVRTSAAGVP